MSEFLCIQFKSWQVLTLVHSNENPTGLVISARKGDRRVGGGGSRLPKNNYRGGGVNGY